MKKSIMLLMTIVFFMLFGITNAQLKNNTKTKDNIMLKAFITSLDGLDEGVQKLYKKLDGGAGYVLEVESVSGYSLENVTNLKSAYEKTKNNLSELTISSAKNTDLLKQFSDLDLTPEQITASVEKAKGLKTDEQVEAMKLQFQGQLDTITQEKADMRTNLRSSLAGNLALTAIGSMQDKFVSTSANPHVKKALVEVIGFKEDGSTFINDGSGNPRQVVTMKDGKSDFVDMSPTQFIEEYLTSESGSIFAAGANNSGTGGAGGGGGGGSSVVTQDQFNNMSMTEQSALFTSDPTRYNALNKV